MWGECGASVGRVWGECGASVEQMSAVCSVVVNIQDISIIKRIKVCTLDLTVFCVTLISVSGAVRCPTIRLRQR